MQGHRGGGNIIINNGPTAAGGHIMQGAGVGGMGVGFPGFSGSFGDLEGLQGPDFRASEMAFIFFSFNNVKRRLG